MDLETRHIKYNETLKYIRQQEKNGKLYVIQPEAALNIGVVERHPEELERVYQIGRKTAEKQLTAIQNFLKKDPALS